MKLGLVGPIIGTSVPGNQRREGKSTDQQTVVCFFVPIQHHHYQLLCRNKTSSNLSLKLFLEVGFGVKAGGGIGQLGVSGG